MKNTLRRLLAMALTVSMVTSMIGVMPVLAADAQDGLNLSKTAAYNETTKQYDITLEAFTTGSVETTTITNPMDIVLVLDQSNSMAWDFDGNPATTDAESRQYAMEEAVKTFIDQVSESSSDHQIAVVTFGHTNDTTTVQGLTAIGNGESLKQKITALTAPDNGKTHSDKGMERAVEILESSSDREQLVVFFSDGQPCGNTDKNTDFNLTIADDAIGYAKTLKDSGATIYTIGIFDGVNPDQITGDATGTGALGESWDRAERGTIDIATANRYMNFLSSNVPNASDLGLDNPNKRGNKLWVIDASPAKTNDAYYLKASNAAELKNVFTTISESVPTPTIGLDSTTVLKDVISDDFTLPAGATTADIKVQTAQVASISGATYTWNAPVDSTLKATIGTDGKTIEVTGFDYNDNVVIDDNGTVSGSKLIVTIPVIPTAGHAGGNNIPTNTAESGIYLKDDLVTAFEIPTVNLPTAPTTPPTPVDPPVAPTKYTLTVESGSGDGSYEADTVVTITADAADTGYHFTGWTTTGGTLANATATTTTITMPADNVTVTATYEKDEEPTTPPTPVDPPVAPTKYTLTVESGSGDGSYEAETAVTITTDAADTGYHFTGWTTTGGTLANATATTTTITMPAANVTVTATYEKDEEPTTPPTPVDPPVAPPVAPSTYEVAAEYVDESGTRIADLVITKNYYSGDAYTTTQKSIDGYTFLRVEGSPSGIVTRNMVVTYVYTAVTDIPEVDPPLTEIPDEPDVPKVDIPEIDPPLTDIPEIEIPLTDVPQTGDTRNIALYAAIAMTSAIGLAWLTKTEYDEKKRTEN